jgi:hypothetical protein
MAAIIVGDPEFLSYRNRATRSTQEFSRQTMGAAFPLGFQYDEVQPGRFRIPVIWGARPVEFTLKPLQRLQPKFQRAHSQQSRTW